MPNKYLGIFLLALLGTARGHPERDCLGSTVEINVYNKSEGSAEQSNLRLPGALLVSSFYGYHAAFGTPIRSHESSLFLVQIPSVDIYACEPFKQVQLNENKAPGKNSSFLKDHPRGINKVALVQRGGNCTFVQKARNIQNLHADFKAMLLFDVSTDECPFMTASTHNDGDEPVTLMAASITATAATNLIKEMEETGNYNSLYISLRQPHQPAYDPSELLLFCIAVFAVTTGSLWRDTILSFAFSSSSSSPFRHRSPPFNPHRPPVVATASHDEDGSSYISQATAASFIFVASAALLFMFIFRGTILLIFMTSILAFIALQSSTMIFTILFYRYCPIERWKQTTQTIVSVPLLEFSALTFSTVLVLTWLILTFTGSHWAWILQDFECLTVVIVFLCCVRFPNLKIASTFLVSAMVYDVWWVFIQPLFLGGPSVMVEVARGFGSLRGVMPILFAVPRIFSLGSNPAASVLGLGDVVLPGLIISMSKEWEDHCRRTNYGNDQRACYYFVPMLVAYGAGLALTFVALLFSWGGDQGQPALLYIVPCVLMTVSFLAWWNGHFMALWRWKEVQGGQGHNDDDLEGGHDDLEQPLLLS